MVLQSLVAQFYALTVDGAFKHVGASNILLTHILLTAFVFTYSLFFQGLNFWPKTKWIEFKAPNSIWCFLWSLSPLGCQDAQQWRALCTFSTTNCIIMWRWRDRTCFPVMEKHTCLIGEINVSVAAWKKVISCRTCSMLCKVVSADWRWWTQTLSDPKDQDMTVCEASVQVMCTHQSVLSARSESLLSAAWRKDISVRGRARVEVKQAGGERSEALQFDLFHVFWLYPVPEIYQMPVSPIKVKRTSFHRFLTFIYSPESNCSLHSHFLSALFSLFTSIYLPLL